MKTKLLLVFTCLLLFSCKKDSSSTDVIYDELSDEQLAKIENAGIDSVSTFENAIFPDGTNMNQWELSNDSGYQILFGKVENLDFKKKLFLKRMTKAGMTIIERPVPSQPNGLAYVYGSKSFSTIYKHPSSVCQQDLYGLDCTSLIYLMGKGSSFNLPVCSNMTGTACLTDVNTWNTAFNNSTDYQGLIMEEVLDKTDIRPGDVIVAKDAHVGMVYSNGASLSIMNSLGKHTNNCNINSNPTHGPVLTPNLTAWLTYVFNNNYHVLRITGDNAFYCSNVIDIDGNQYNSISIGFDCWTDLNLRVTRYKNGDPIPQITDQTEWANATIGAWCWYNNDPLSEGKYGKIYNGYAVNDQRGLAPDGWHIPSDADWDTLVSNLGGSLVAGGKMKAVNSLWTSSISGGATNTSGFSGLPGGRRDSNGAFYEVTNAGIWWSSFTQGNLTQTNGRRLLYNAPDIYGFNLSRERGAYVRCIKN